MGAPPTDRPLRTVRSFVRRQGRITERQEAAISENWALFGIDYEPKMLDFDAIFGRAAIRNLEIGFGKGEAILSMAQAYPEEDFLGIEVFNPGVGHVIDELRQTGVTNARVMRHDAVEVLSHQIPDASFDHIYIFFADPWPKKRHHKRRLINTKFTELLAKKLKLGGHLYLATDWKPYAEHILDVISANAQFENTSSNGYSARHPRRPLTKFERRGQLLGHEVWDLDFVRK